MSLFNEELANTKEIFSGEIAFKLYDTYGFPLDLTEDMLRDKNLKVDLNKFDELMNAQKAMAKAAWKGSGDATNEGDFKQLIEKYGINEFVGYENVSYKSKILALLDENFKEVTTLEKNSSGWVMLDKTPFYATSGGQNGDIGALEDNKHIAIIEETSKFHGLNLSKVRIENSTLNQGENVDAVVVNRYEVAKHHSATHLLQSALKMVLGDTVSQAGSLNDANRLRFDFTYPKAMTTEQIEEVEDLVNSMIARGISGNIELLQIDLPNGKNIDKYVDRMKESTRRMVGLTNQLLAYAGGGKYRPKIMSLNEVVKDTLPLIQHQINPAIRVETYLPGDISHVKIDPTQMQMVLSAVLNNAAESIEGEGHLRITTRDRKIDKEFVETHPYFKAGRYVCLTIEDEGKGMDQKTKSRVFEPFFTRKFQGRGLGMAAVYGIVKNHGGWISVDSKLGKGTVVRIYLPAVESKPQEEEKLKAEPGQRNEYYSGYRV